MGLNSMDKELTKWALKWIEGSVLSYVQGRTTLSIVVGRVKRAIRSYGVTEEEVIALIDLIEQSPVYLPTMSRNEKAARLQSLRDDLKRAK